MELDWDNLTNRKLLVFLAVAILLWIIGILIGNYHFINYGNGVFIVFVVFFLLKRHYSNE